MIPHIADSDPDPTSQIPWPTARSRPQDQPDSNGVGDSAGTSTPSEINNKRVTKPPAKRRLSTWDLITLSISMGGAQMVWTVELGYVESVDAVLTGVRNVVLTIRLTLAVTVPRFCWN